MKKLLVTAALGGGVGGLLDCLYATILWGFILGHNPAGIWQSVASGLLGKASYDGGSATVVLGLALHFFIAFLMAVAYILASRPLPVLIARPVLMGVLYGLLLYLVMNFVVVPLSAIGPRFPTSIKSVVLPLLPHILFVGPAIALITARRARASQ